MLFSDYVKTEPLRLDIDIETDVEDLDSIRRYYKELDEILKNHEYNVQNNKRVQR